MLIFHPLERALNNMSEAAHTKSGSRIWLTGASYGIGRSLAIELARSGARIGITARSEDKLEQVQADIEAAGGSAMPLPGDVTDRAAMKELAERMRSEMGGIDILVANAGTHLRTEVERFDVAEYMSLMNLNYAGALNCIEAVLPEMLRTGSGQIVGVASLAGYRGVPSAAAYGASKAALIHFLESMRFDVRDHGISVTIVNPGFVKTPLTDKNEFKMPFMIDSDKAARIIRRGIERKKREIAFPRPFSSFIKFLRILPMSLYIALMGKTWKRMQID
ncbi:MAG: hypothetical protein CMJ24_06965 [Phycisphaerae bacterium]|nr:hypothetical protein [Phycisphaerae bacterium]